MGSGSRLYSAEDVVRLTLVKRLVDHGDAISRVASLGIEELRERLRGDVLPRADGVPVRPYRVVVLGGLLASRLGTVGGSTAGVEIVAAYQDRARLAQEAPAPSPDLLVLEYPTLHAEQVREVGALLAQSGVSRAIVVYNFASRATLARLDGRRVIAWRAPLDPAELVRWWARSQGLVIEPLIAVKRDEHHPPVSERFDEPPELPANPTPVQRMTRRLKTGAGRAAYALRKSTVEPVFGIIKSVMGFRQFLTRGLDNVQGEWTLVCLAWNLKRMAVLRLQ